MSNIAPSGVPGSIAEHSARTGRSIAEVMGDVECLCIVDVSGSMAACDSKHQQSRFQTACDELKNLQAQHQGAIAVIQFSSEPRLMISGTLSFDGDSTDVAAALEMALPMDETCTIVLISDGEPDSEKQALDAARRYKGPIHTIYVGPDGGDGASFLRKLARLTGGQSDSNFAMAQHSLAGTITKLLTV